MNLILYITAFFFVALFILLCIQIYWIFQIMIYKVSSKKHVLLAFFLLSLNLVLITIVLYPMELARYDSHLMDRAFNPITDLLYGMLIIVLYILCVYFLVLDTNKINNQITNESIREALNKMSAGLCFYDETGLPLLTNELMESISQSLLYSSLSNGKEFWNKIESDMSIHGIRIHADYPTLLLNNGKAYSFSNQIIVLGEEKIYQLIASDVTDLYSKSKKIEEDTKILASIHTRLQEYSQQVSILTRDEEILRSKIHIHDNLGYSIIATKYYLSNPNFKMSKTELLNAWKTNISLLNKENEENQKENVLSILENAANAIGLKLVFEGDITNWSAAHKKIFMMAVKESMTNAIQHAHANQLNVHVEDKNGCHILTLTNNGKQPVSITEGGGLTSLRHRVEEAFGTMSEKLEDTFSLVIELPERETGYV